MTVQCELNSEADTVQFAKLLAELLPNNCLVALDGTLGAGKTRLVRAFAEACGVPASEVTSPTFTLWQTYEGTRTIHHLDAYRIADEDEFDALGFEECLEADCVTFVEWASRVENCLPRTDRLSIHIKVISDTERLALITADDPKLEKVLPERWRSRDPRQG